MNPWASPEDSKIQRAPTRERDQETAVQGQLEVNSRRGSTQSLTSVAEVVVKLARARGAEAAERLEGFAGLLEPTTADPSITLGAAEGLARSATERMAWMATETVYRRASEMLSDGFDPEGRYPGIWRPDFTAPTADMDTRGVYGERIAEEQFSPRAERAVRAALDRALDDGQFPNAFQLERSRREALAERTAPLPFARSQPAPLEPDASPERNGRRDDLRRAAREMIERLDAKAREFRDLGPASSSSAERTLAR